MKIPFDLTNQILKFLAVLILVVLGNATICSASKITSKADKPIPYLQDVKRKIFQHWSPPKGSKGYSKPRRIMISFSIWGTGEITGLGSNSQSPFQHEEEQAEKAILEAQPFSPFFPKDKCIPVEVTFESLNDKNSIYIKTHLKNLELSQTHSSLDKSTPYMVDLRCSIKHHWSPPKAKEDDLDLRPRRITIRFKVNNNGEISNLKLVRGCHSKYAEDQALEAVKESAPFPSPSLNSKDKTINVEAIFESLGDDVNKVSARQISTH